MTARKWLLVGLAVPFVLFGVGVQLSILTGVVGAAQLAWAARTGSIDEVERGLAIAGASAWLLDRTVANPVVRLAEVSPITFGAVDELRATTHVLAQGAAAAVPAVRLAELAGGVPGTDPIIAGSTIDTARVAEMRQPVAQLHDRLAGTEAALASVPESGLLGQPLGQRIRRLTTMVADATTLTGTLDVAMPDLPDALGAQGTRRYLVCALNDAELFGSGGAPLYAFLVQADNGTVTVPLSGQLGSRLSPGNPRVAWEHVGQRPWYQDGRTYPFVNSNFHPDFRTASQDMTRAWAALGYPEVDGVVTLDVNALANILREIGPVEATGYGRVTADTLVRAVLVDAYRTFGDSPTADVRHTWNDSLARSVQTAMFEPSNAAGVVRALLESIPERHVQASFTADGLQRAASRLGATGALSDSPGDLVATFSQGSPNKNSVFQDRRIEQTVTLTDGGGARVRRVVSITNAIPEGLEGDPTTALGYTALRSRQMIAHRIPLTATDVTLRTRGGDAFGGRVGPYDDQRGGAVLWRGVELGVRRTATMTVEYTLPAGTFPAGTYAAAVDPQALTLPAPLTLTVIPQEGRRLAGRAGWTRTPEGLTWVGVIDRPLRLEVGP